MTRILQFLYFKFHAFRSLHSLYVRIFRRHKPTFKCYEIFLFVNSTQWGGEGTAYHIAKNIFKECRGLRFERGQEMEYFVVTCWFHSALSKKTIKTIIQDEYVSGHSDLIDDLRVHPIIMSYRDDFTDQVRKELGIEVA